MTLPPNPQYADPAGGNRIDIRQHLPRLGVIRIEPDDPFYGGRKKALSAWLGHGRLAVGLRPTRRRPPARGIELKTGIDCTSPALFAPPRPNAEQARAAKRPRMRRGEGEGEGEGWTIRMDSDDSFPSEPGRLG